jgi:hypothetical protein
MSIVKGSGKWSTAQKEAAARRRKARMTRARKATPLIHDMDAQGKSLLEIATSVGLEPFVVDAILRRRRPS